METGVKMDIEDSTSTNGVEKSKRGDVVQSSSDNMASTSFQIANQSSLDKFEMQMINCYHRNSKWILSVLKCVAGLLGLVYLVFALQHSFSDQDSLLLIAIAIFVVSTISLRVLKQNKHLLANVFSRENEQKVFETVEKFSGLIKKNSSKISWFVVVALLSSVAVFIVSDIVFSSRNFYNLVSTTGILLYVGLFWIFSSNRRQICWSTVFWGFCLQLLLALLTLRTKFGLAAFEWTGDKISDFLELSDAGCEFVFGKNYREHFFAFKITSMLVFFGSALAVLNHYGIVQRVINAIAFVLQFSMGTTACESVSAAANIFLSGVETSMLIEPLLSTASKSELHAIMSGGLATVAGGYMAVYIELGVPAEHLLTASVLSAPASLVMAKILYPQLPEPIQEEHDSSTRTENKQKNFSVRTYGNVFDAISGGAGESVAIAANVLANLIAFTSLLRGIDVLLGWLGQRVGIEQLTFEVVCSYVMWPFAFVMGIEMADCRQMARLIGVKSFVSTFISYQQLADIIKNGQIFRDHIASNGSWYQDGSDIRIVRYDGNETLLVNGVMSERSTTIATYALCSLANLSTCGMMVAALTSLIPHRKKDFSSCVVSALISGHVASHITACIVGLFYNLG